uniref:Natural killer cell granule protein 7 n=1 Tax=Colobus angolensis palliatus TaxID=336983 RepID=A0A2K5I7S8_COLAP
MEPYRSLAMLVGFLGLMFCLIALSTDFWFEAVGPNHTAHSGLWPTGHGDNIAGHGPLVSTITAFAAGALSLGAHCRSPRPGYETL